MLTVQVPRATPWRDARVVRRTPRLTSQQRQQSWKQIPRALFSTTQRALRTLDGRTYATASEALDTQEPPDPVDPFLQRSTADYIDSIYADWKRNPDAVHVSWQMYFRNMENRSLAATQALQPPPELVSSDRVQSSDTVNYLKARSVVHAFRERGHTEAKINPLEPPANASYGSNISSTLAANLEQFGFTAADLETQIPLGPQLLPQFAQEGKSSSMSLWGIIAACEAIYCGSIGIEVQHISDPEKRKWLRSQLEAPRSPLSVDDKRGILDNLIWATSLERFLAARFPNEKRFGLDGAEGLAPAVASLMDRSVDAHGVEDIIIGSCHRGKLNMMSTVYGRRHEALFRQFLSTAEPNVENGESGDVKSHYGMDGHRVTAAGNSVAVSLLPNPSHLEAIDPVSQGKTKAVQASTCEADHSKVMLLALHGDAAFSGQGAVYETLNLAQIRGYQVGGTVRFAVNNQVGFTTDPIEARSTPYCTDVAKYVEAPVLHINGDDPEALVYACRLAADWRARFKADVMVDVVCYRRFGHNEIDQAGFTQPEMYRQIAAQEPLLEKYAKKLVSEGTVSAQTIEEQKQRVWEQLEQKFAKSKEPQDSATITSVETPTPEPHQTSVEEGTLRKIANQITTVPKSFALHRNLQRILSSQRTDFDAGSVNWSTAEALAYGSLLLEGHPVRISGEDVQRGTFSQRHSVLHDQTTHETYTPLNHLDPIQPAPYTAVNSPLSEFGVLGFEYGYSLAAPNALVVWEAQFGDFVNNAQVIVDQFIASGETKWSLNAGLVLSLPHGYDGQGPEHSSARLGRFLELCNEDPRKMHLDQAKQRADCNIQVVCMTSPANLFHALRRQIHSRSKKPLIIFFSKFLLRHPLARSDIKALASSSQFQPILPDSEHDAHTIVPKRDIKRLILCSGQIYTALHKHRSTHSLTHVAIIRLEELHPFPFAALRDTITSYPNAESIVWCQEEPYNGGAWQYVRDRVETVLGATGKHGMRLVYAGRGTGAATATGSMKVHIREEGRLVEEAFNIQTFLDGTESGVLYKSYSL